ncbi:hypothetical protein [Nocardia sp. CDC160]|uniref:hypothetical protein n=1 Tax=Nocardia sp. CDC160 TaxID=3112166 RepID=UPI002DBB0508|nr:hypothetical protein [Nocardia sp. CDC160]MEC3920182.1 hypothetical protein [Nocardia sp. CDC160]
MAASFDLHSLAVLGAAEDRLVIWHVNVGAGLGESRLSGAWVLEDSRTAEIESLTAAYPIAVTGGGLSIAGRKEESVAAGASAAPLDANAAVVTSGSGVAIAATSGIVDVDATVETVCAEIESVDARFSERQDAAGGKYTRPQWPTIVPPGEVSLTQSQVDVVDDHIRPVLTLARALADLADAWAAFESLRLARPFLVELGGPVARPLPLAVR